MATSPLPTCQYRGRSLGAHRHACSSPLLVIGPEGVPDHRCDSCQVRDIGAPNCTALPAPTAGQVRHLAYHLYPHGEFWRLNLEALRRRVGLFNGRRILAIAADRDSPEYDQVELQARGMGCELIGLANDPRLWEMASYPRLLRELAKHAGAADVTFYGHGKGVTSQYRAAAVALWRDALYEAMLDYWPAIAAQLGRAAAVGQFLRPRHIIPNSSCRWHFSGNFHWHRNADLYSRKWDDYDQHYCGAESHLGRVFRRDEVVCLYGEHSTAGLGLYLQQTWDGAATVQHRQWCEQHAGDCRQPLLLSVILTAAKQPLLVHEAIASVQAQTSDEWELVVLDSGPMLDAGVYDRYAGDARIRIFGTGETSADKAAHGMQAWAINRAHQRGVVRGDLVLHLCDDDVLAPRAVAAFLAAARAKPTADAWYGPAIRAARSSAGVERVLGRLDICGVFDGCHKPDCRVDGMQVCCRRAIAPAWPEDLAEAWHADGLWMNELARVVPIMPIEELVGIHRHTPLSTFTRGA